MKRLYYLILLIILGGCTLSKKTEVYFFSKYNLPIAEETEGLSMKSLDSLLVQTEMNEYPMFAELEQAETFGEIREIQQRDFTQHDRREVKQRIRELKTQMQQLDEYQMPKDTLIDQFDENFQQAKKLGIWSLVMSIVGSIAIAAPLLFLLLFVASIVTAIMSLKRYKRSFDKRFKALPIIALVINGAWVVLFLIAIIILIAWLSGGTW